MAVPGSIVVSGRVLDVAPLSGVSAKTGNPWSFTVVSILAGKVVQEVRFESRTEGSPPKVDDDIAVEIALGTYQNQVQCTALRYVHPVGVKAAS